MPFVHPLWGPLHLGRSKRSVHTPKSLAKRDKVSAYLDTLPDAPPICDYTSGIITWGQMMNDTIGDCTCAAAGHLIQDWTAAAGSEVTIPDTAVLSAYEAVGGYVPGKESTDNGAQISDVLNYFQNTGIGGYQITAHAEVNLTQMRVQQGLYTFGGLDLGINLPLSAQNQVGDTWDFVNDTPDEPGSWGGHSVAAVYYSSTGVDCVTWGALQHMTWRWFMYYCEEAHAMIFPQWKPPVDVSQLVSDLSQVGT